MVVGQRTLQIDSSEPFIPLQKFDKTVDGGDWTGDEEIEAFRCQQHGAFEAKVETHAPEDGLQAVEVDEVDEVDKVDELVELDELDDLDKLLLDYTNSRYWQSKEQ